MKNIRLITFSKERYCFIGKNNNVRNRILASRRVKKRALGWSAIAGHKLTGHKLIKTIRSNDKIEYIVHYDPGVEHIDLDIKIEKDIDFD